MTGKIAETDNSTASLFLRLALGIVFFPHGAQKALGWFGGAGFSGTIELFGTRMHLPPVAVVMLMATELLGSVCLIIGFLSRIWAFGIGLSILACAYMNHLQNGFFMNWFGQQKGEGVEFHILVLGMTVALIIRGSGAFSLDRVITRS
jgi:putative oxidoreductase